MICPSATGIGEFKTGANDVNVMIDDAKMFDDDVDIVIAIVLRSLE